MTWEGGEVGSRINVTALNPKSSFFTLNHGSASPRHVLNVFTLEVSPTLREFSINCFLSALSRSLLKSGYSWHFMYSHRYI
ncbi:MAG: hypothetical protein [Cressdnaviricota sp.]|nr:MAG: hypothetical protein [Cressdnaviricota sp.]